MKTEWSEIDAQLAVTKAEKEMVAHMLSEGRYTIDCRNIIAECDRKIALLEARQIMGITFSISK